MIRTCRSSGSTAVQRHPRAAASVQREDARAPMRSRAQTNTARSSWGSTTSLRVPRSPGKRFRARLARTDSDPDCSPKAVNHSTGPRRSLRGFGRTNIQCSIASQTSTRKLRPGSTQRTKPEVYGVRYSQFIDLINVTVACDMTRAATVALTQMLNTEFGAPPGDVHQDFAHVADGASPARSPLSK